MAKAPARDLRRKTRREALAHIRARFIGGVYPRLTVLAFVGLSGAAAVGVSAGLFRLGLEQLGYRYAVATIAGYAVFLLLIRIWIAFLRPKHSPDSLDYVPDLPMRDATVGDGSVGFSGGSSGGGGASGGWGSPADGGGPHIPLPDVDADEAWPVVAAVMVAAVVLLGAVVATLYVVYYAPVLLAEIALDAALVTGIYRRLRRQDARHWLGSAIRHTWRPALVILVSLFVLGTVLQWTNPSMRTIGDVLR